MIHHVREENDVYSISKKNLSSIIKESKAKTINIEEIESHCNYVVFTVDDVPEDFYYNGFPLFVKHNVPFTIFVNTDLLDKKGYINKTQLLDMLKYPLCTLGSHGTLHCMYKDLDKNEKHSFLLDSRNYLSTISNRTVNVFAFPYGSFFAMGFKHLKYPKYYYKYSFCTFHSFVPSWPMYKFFIPRINLNNSYYERSLK